MWNWMAVGLLIITSFVQNVTISAQTSGRCDPAKPPVIPGQTEHTLTHDGIERRYLLYVPTGYEPKTGAPLVLSIHGFASNPQQQADISEWNQIADQYGFIVVYPQGTGFPLRWNAGQTSFVRAEGADDVGFITALLDQLETDLCINPAQIYVNGLSNGAGMSNRLACQLADRIAAIGGVAGAYNPIPGGCEPSRPVPVIVFHGTDDPIVPYAGGRAGGLDLPLIEIWARRWAQRNGCTLTPEVTDVSTHVTRTAYTGCDANVILYTIDGGGHTWPGGLPLPEFIVGQTSQEIDASELMWEFFMANPLPD